MNKVGSKTESKKVTRKLTRHTHVVFGTIAGLIATVVVHPLNVVKVRMQVRQKTTTTLTTLRLIIQCEGYRALYAGLSAALLRQTTLTTTRLFTYHMLLDSYKRSLPTEATLNTNTRMKLGVVAGVVGGVIGSPAELSMIRMMVDGPKLCSKCRRTRSFNHVFHAFYKISKANGVLALWRGSTLTMWRSVAFSVSHLWTYSKMNEYLRQRKVKRGYPVYILTSLTSAFIASCLSLPFDLVKTRIQSASQKQRQLDVVRGVLLARGARALWVGFVPYFVRLGPHTVITFTVLQQLNSAYLNWRWPDRKGLG